MIAYGWIAKFAWSVTEDDHFYQYCFTYFFIQNCFISSQSWCAPVISFGNATQTLKRRDNNTMHFHANFTLIVVSGKRYRL